MPPITVVISPRILFQALALIVGIAALMNFPFIIALVLVALILAAALAPAVNYFTAKRIPRPLATLLVFVLIFGSLGLVGMILIPVLIAQIQDLVKDFPAYVAQYETLLQSLRALEAQYHVLPSTTQIATFISQRASGWLASTLTATAAVASALIGLGGVLITTFFLLADGPNLRKGFLSLIPPQYRDRIAQQFDPIAQRLGAYVRGQLMSMAALSILLGIGLTIAGVPYAWVLAAIAGLMEIIPLVGSTLGAIPAVIVAFTVSWKLALIVIAIFAVSNVIQGNVISPLILSSSVEMPPILVFFAIMIGAEMLGIVGAIIAVPIVATLMVLIQNLYIPSIEKQNLVEPAPATAAPPPEV
ncbi:AI-2 transport protein TqsA [compost metagenome]